MPFTPFIVQMVGHPEQPEQTVDAYNPMHAVAQVARCGVLDVCIPIWSRDNTECYMPRDDSGRQWLVREVRQ